ncbi:MAG: hypothetical protein ACRD2Q_12445 [Terriglobales bacterium]
MRSKLSGIALLVLIAMLFLPLSALAKDRGHGNGKKKWKQQSRVVYRISDPGWRYYQIGGRYYGPYNYQPGRRVGWGGCDLPPGLAKKYGCRGQWTRMDRIYRGYPVISIPLDDTGRFRLEFRGGY